MDAVSIPVIASSGAGAPEHFSEIFKTTNVQAVSYSCLSRSNLPIFDVSIFSRSKLFHVSAIYLTLPPPHTSCPTDGRQALAAGIFHRKEVSIMDVKGHLIEHRIPARKYA